MARRRKAIDERRRTANEGEGTSANAPRRTTGRTNAREFVEGSRARRRAMAMALVVWLSRARGARAVPVQYTRTTLDTAMDACVSSGDPTHGSDVRGFGEHADRELGRFGSE